MNKFLAVIALSLFSSLPVYADLLDPTRPPEWLNQTTPLLMQTWRVDSILIANNRKVAIINGQVVKVGDAVGENKITAIEKDSVKLEGPDGEIVLFLIEKVVKQPLNTES